MRIEDAKKACSAQLNALKNQRNTLTKLLSEKEDGGEWHSFDRVEISRKLSEVDAQYQATQKVLDGILANEMAVYQSEIAKQQCEAAAEGAEEFGKILTIYRRIASGGHVPPKDERRLMEFSHELYMAAKAAAMMKEGEGEEYDSLWKDEKAKNDNENSASEVSVDTQVPVPCPEQVIEAVCIE